MQTQKRHVIFSKEFCNVIPAYYFHFRHTLCSLCGDGISLCFYRGISSSTQPHYLQSQSSISQICPTFVHQKLTCKASMKYYRTPRSWLIYLLYLNGIFGQFSTTFSNLHILINIDLLWLLVAATCVNFRICHQTIINMIFETKISLKFNINDSLLTDNPESKPELSDLKPVIYFFLFSFCFEKFGLQYGKEESAKTIKLHNLLIYSCQHQF